MTKQEEKKDLGFREGQGKSQEDRHINIVGTEPKGVGAEITGQHIP